MDEQVQQKTESFFAKFKQQSFKKGEIIVRADEEPRGVYYIREGTVRQYLISKKGDEIVVNIYKPHSFFPLSWAVNRTKNLYYFEALSDTTTYRAPGDEVVRLLSENSDILFDLTERIYRGIDGLLIRMAYLMSGSAFERLLTELIILAKRFGTQGTDNKSVVITVVEKDIASQSGLTRETVSREMKLLKDKNMLSFKNNQLVIFDLKVLEDELANS